MGDPKHLSAQIDGESDLWENFTEYRDPGESKSATTRELLRSGLAREGYMQTPRDTAPHPTGFAVSVYELAISTFQISVIGVVASVIVTVLGAQALFAPFRLLTASALAVSILATLTAAVAARVNLSMLAVRSRILNL